MPSGSERTEVGPGTKPIVHAAAYAAPWLAGQVLLYLWVGYAPWIGGDTVTAQFALGLSWVTGTPLMLIHVPLPFASQFAGLGVALTAQPLDSLMAYQNTTLVLSAGMVVLCAVWYAWAASRLRFPVAAGLIAGCVGASMPTVMLSAVAFTGYFVPSVWLPAGFMVVLGGILRGRPADVATASGLAAIGFSAANVYSALTVTIAIVVVMVLTLGRNPLAELRRLGSEGAPSVWGSALLAVAGFSVALGVMVAIVRPQPTMAVMWKYLLVAFVASALAAAAVHKWRAFHPVVAGLRRIVVLPLLVGWIIGANVWSPLWILNAVFSVARRGGAGPVKNDPSLGFGQLFTMAPDTPWALLLLVALALSAVLLVLPRLLGPALVTADTRKLALVPLLGSGLLLAMVGDLIGSGTVAAYTPIDLRYLLPLIGPVAWAFGVVAFADVKGAKTIATALVLVAAVASLIRFGAAAAAAAEDYAARDAELDRQIDAFLEETKTGKVICFGAEHPGRCSALWGYLSYRPPASVERLPPPMIADGRLRYVIRCKDAACLPEGVLSDIRGEPILFLTPSEQPEVASILARHLPPSLGYDCRLTSGPLPKTGDFAAFLVGACTAVKAH